MAEGDKPWRVEVTGRRRLLDAFFKVDEVTVSHELFAGGMSEPRPWLVFERGDAVAALLCDPDRSKVIVVNQFRVPTLERGQHRGWLVETVAGMIPVSPEGVPLERPEQTLIREVFEETGYQITQATRICTYFSSPGGSSERIHLFYGEVRATNKAGKGGGVVADGEDIEVVEYDIDQFFWKLAAGEFEDPKLIIAGQWLLARRGFIKRVDEKPRTFYVQLNDRQRLGIKTGDIRGIKDVQVWVNSENTDMMMDRFFGRSVSARIRVGGAKKNPDGSIFEDTIGNALRAEMRTRNFVQPGTVIYTTSGELAATHNVSAIFHVASVAGEIGEGLSTTKENLLHSLDNVLRAISRRRYHSTLVPIFGTGDGGYTVSEVAPDLIGKAYSFLRENLKAPLREIYFLAYSHGDLEIIRSAIQQYTNRPVEEETD